MRCANSSATTTARRLKRSIVYNLLFDVTLFQFIFAPYVFARLPSSKTLSYVKREFCLVEIFRDIIFEFVLIFIFLLLTLTSYTGYLRFAPVKLFLFCCCFFFAVRQRHTFPRCFRLPKIRPVNFELSNKWTKPDSNTCLPVLLPVINLSHCGLPHNSRLEECTNNFVFILAYFSSDCSFVSSLFWGIINIPRSIESLFFFPVVCVFI